jgi:hypothetical protein
MVGRLLRLSLAVLACSAVTAAGAAASVLYVGDSLGVGTAPYLREQLGGTGLDLDAEIGRPSGAGVEVLESLLGPEHEVVVFDLGTNDDPAASQVLAADLDRARELAGSRCLVVATLNRPPLNGVPIDGLNRTVASFAAADSNVALVDWRSAVAEDPGLLTDGVHADAEGYAVRAGLFADAIGSCAGFGSASTAPDPAELPPPVSAGWQTDERGGAPKPREQADQGDPRVAALAAALARAVATGADFG